MLARMMLVLLLLSWSLSGNLNSSDYRFEGLFEKANQNSRYGLIEKIIEPDDVLFEAGGFDGGDTIHLVKLVPQGKIITFEPNPSRFQELVDKTKNISNVKTYPFALCEYNGTIEFNLCHGPTNNRAYEGASSILPASDSMKLNYKGPKIQVPCVILDDWCRNNGVNKIDFMWLDLEGYELQMLRSSPRILKTVKAMYVETNFFEFRKGMTLYPTLRAFLESQGFRMLSHWYHKGRQGDAVFVRAELFDKFVQKLSLTFTK